MTAANFEKCLDEVFRHEGGYVDHPRDPGGATNMGITHKTLARWRKITPWWKLAKSDVRNLSRREAGEIYRALYWNAIAGNALPSGLDLALFDFAVNSGPKRAIIELQRLLGVRADGIIGVLTRSATRAALGKHGAAKIIQMLCARRMSFLRRLKIFATFGRGWSRRVASVERAALSIAGTTKIKETQPRRPIMDILTGYKTYIVGVLMLVAGIAQMAGVDVPGFSGQTAGQLIFEGLAVVFLRKGLKSDIGNA